VLLLKSTGVGVSAIEECIDDEEEDEEDVEESDEENAVESDNDDAEC
jgi:hypothetical protein